LVTDKKVTVFSRHKQLGYLTPKHDGYNIQVQLFMDSNGFPAVKALLAGGGESQAFAKLFDTRKIPEQLFQHRTVVVGEGVAYLFDEEELGHAGMSRALAIVEHCEANRVFCPVTLRFHAFRLFSIGDPADPSSLMGDRIAFYPNTLLFMEHVFKDLPYVHAVQFEVFEVMENGDIHFKDIEAPVLPPQAPSATPQDVMPFLSEFAKSGPRPHCNVGSFLDYVLDKFGCGEGGVVTADTSGWGELTRGYSPGTDTSKPRRFACVKAKKDFKAKLLLKVNNDGTSYTLHDQGHESGPPCAVLSKPFIYVRAGVQPGCSRLFNVTFTWCSISKLTFRTSITGVCQILASDACGPDESADDLVDVCYRHAHYNAIHEALGRLDDAAADVGYMDQCGKRKRARMSRGEVDEINARFERDASEMRKAPKRTCFRSLFTMDH
jgi:hypothetical protein